MNVYVDLRDDVMLSGAKHSVVALGASVSTIVKETLPSQPPLPQSDKYESEVQDVERTESQVLGCACDLSYARGGNGEIRREYSECGSMCRETHNYLGCGHRH